jgi:hypothetical protein
MSVVLTIYLVKSFEYRTMKTLVLKDVDLHMKASELQALIYSNILSPTQTTICPPLLRAFLSVILNLSHTYKTNPPICRTEIPRWVPSSIVPTAVNAKIHSPPRFQIPCAL